MFQNISNFYIYFKTCISSSIACYLNFKPFKNISKIIQSSKFLFQAFTVDRAVDRIYFNPDRSTFRSTGPCGFERARLCTSVGRPGQSTDRYCGRPTVDRLQDPNSRVLSVDRPGRPTAVQKPQRLFLGICLFFLIPTAISEFLVAKLYPNDLESIMTVSYTHLTLPTIYSV